MANVTYTFVAGTKAVAGQVNKNFQDCINGINQNASAITQNSSDISSLQTGKANKNGSSTERFSVANPTSQYEAINKGYLENAISPVVSYIKGLIISIVSGETTKIAISAGSCYDNTEKELITLTASYTAEYSGTLSANTTYDVFIRKAKSDSSVDCAVLAHEATPSSTDYYYRKIGECSTNGDAEIIATVSYSNSIEYVGYPNLINGVSKTTNTNHTADSNGWVTVYATANGATDSKYFTLNGVTVWEIAVISTTGNVRALDMFPVRKGDVYKLSAGTLTFYAN